MNNELRRIKISNKIYPYFYGFSSDLIFWVAINTIFLTVVKGLSAAEINSLISISTAVSIIVQIFSIKIIKKIGNMNSVKLGTFMLFLASIILTISNNYMLLLIGHIFYSCSFIFKNMDNVILVRNLKTLGEQEDYLKIQNKGSIIYSFLTMFISIISGFLFNINNYIPMIICIFFCFINVILSNFIYETKNYINEKKEENDKFKFTKTLIFIFLLYGLFYSTIELGQENSKLYIQNNLEEILSNSQIVLILSVAISISRIVRLLSNVAFIKIYDKLKNKIIYYLEFFLVLAFFLLLLGRLIGYSIIGTIIMIVGFCLFLAIRDPFDNYMKKMLFDNCELVNQEKATNYLYLSRKIGNLIISLLITCLLFKFTLTSVMIILFIMSIMYVIIIRKIYLFIIKK